MPELPEVETTCRGIEPYIVNQRIEQCVIHDTRLRWPIDEKKLKKQLKKACILEVKRRGKYIILVLTTGHLVIHLGMSGTLSIQSLTRPTKKHDHVICLLSNEHRLVFNDPRRFGSVLFAKTLDSLKPLQKLGPEPLSDTFDAPYLNAMAQKRKITLKQLIMDNQVVVGVGNIYASESLFDAKLNPLRQASTLTLKEAKQLVIAIRNTLKAAIKAGGTTLKDFLNADGKAAGYFQQQLQVYGRENLACHRCDTTIQRCVTQQRATYFCPSCQKL